MHNTKPLFLGLLCAALLMPAQSEASIIVKLTDKQMAQRANRIVHGKVVRQYSDWDKNRRRIYTYTIISVLDRIKGTPTQELTIRQVGGAKDNIGMRVPGSAKFKLGEEVVVFLESIKKTAFHHVMGMSYGKYTVVRDAKTQQLLLKRNLHNIAVASKNSKGRYKIQHAKDSKKPLVLETFIKKIRYYVALPKLQQQKTTPRLQTTPK